MAKPWQPTVQASNRLAGHYDFLRRTVASYDEGFPVCDLGSGKCMKTLNYAAFFLAESEKTRLNTVEIQFFLLF